MRVSKNNIGVRTVESSMSQKELANRSLFDPIPTVGFSNIWTLDQVNVHNVERGEKCLRWPIVEFWKNGYAILKDHQ